MALKASPSVSRCLVLGWSDPRPYDAGSIGGRAFPAGRSMRVCVGTEEHDFTVLKVKSANVDKVAGVLAQLGGRWGDVEIEFLPGTPDRQAELLGIKILQAAK